MLFLIGVTVHFVKFWKLRSNFLALKHTPKSHTSVNLISELKDVIGEWDLTSKVIAISADGASNIKKVNLQKKLKYKKCIIYKI